MTIVKLLHLWCLDQCDNCHAESDIEFLVSRLFDFCTAVTLRETTTQIPKLTPRDKCKCQENMWNIIMGYIQGYPGIGSICTGIFNQRFYAIVNPRVDLIWVTLIEIVGKGDY